MQSVHCQFLIGAKYRRNGRLNRARETQIIDKNFTASACKL